MLSQKSEITQTPKKSAVPSLFPPVGTLSLCVMTIGAAIAQSIFGEERISLAVGVILDNLLNFSSLVSVGEGQIIPTWLTLFTYVFPHGGWWHVLPNVVALWIFGALSERVIGTWGFVLAYFVSGAVGVFCHALIPPHLESPIAGASLAISGMIGVYAALLWLKRPRSRYQRLLVSTLEGVALIGIVLWLVFRRVPDEPGAIHSIMYHFIPFLVMWFGVLFYSRGRSFVLKAMRGRAA